MGKSESVAYRYIGVALSVVCHRKYNLDTLDEQMYCGGRYYYTPLRFIDIFSIFRQWVAPAASGSGGRVEIPTPIDHVVSGGCDQLKLPMDLNFA